MDILLAGKWSTTDCLLIGSKQALQGLFQDAFFAVLKSDSHGKA